METLRINKILVPLDFSEVSLEALETAINMTLLHKAEICLLNVIEYFDYPTTENSATLIVREVMEMNKLAKENLAKKAEEIKARYKLEPTVLSLMGSVTDAIINTAVNSNIDLIVMGTHGISGLREFFIGSNAYSVIKKTPCPVLTVPLGQKKQSFKEILFPVRLITQALDKYEVVREIVKKNKATLHVLGIIREKESEETIKQLKQQLSILLNSLDEDGIAHTGLIIESNDPAKETLQKAKEINADLIVTTANLDHTLGELFVGPYVQQIVNHSKYPVFSTRPPLSAGTLMNMKKEAEKMLYTT